MYLCVSLRVVHASVWDGTCFSVCSTLCGTCICVFPCYVVHVSVCFYIMWYMCVCISMLCGTCICVFSYHVVHVSVSFRIMWYMYLCLSISCGTCICAFPYHVVHVSVCFCIMWYMYLYLSISCGTCMCVYPYHWTSGLLLPKLDEGFLMYMMSSMSCWQPNQSRDWNELNWTVKGLNWSEQWS